MAKGFNLTAEINLRGPSNVKTVIADIRRQLGTIDTAVTVKIDPQAANNANKLAGVLTRLNNVLTTTSTQSRLTATNISQLATALNSFQTSASAASRSLNGLPRNIAQTTQNIQRAAQQTAAARTELEEFGRQSALAVRRFAAFSLATGAIYSLVNAVSKATKEFIEFDRQIVRLTQITGDSYEQLGGLTNTITGLSTSLGVASSDLIGIADTLAQAGLSAKETEQALKALALTAVAPSFDNLNETVEGSIALMRQFGISTKDLEKSLSSINSVAAKFAVESSDIITAIQRTGGVFSAASKGVSEGTDALNEFVAVFTSIRATTRESAETIATGLRTIFTRIQRADTIEALKDYGVTLTDVEGKFVGAYRAVELLAQGLGKLDPRDLKFSQIVEELGGFRQIGKVLPLIQQFGTAQDALKTAYAGQGSLANDAIKAQAALATQFAKTRENFVALIRDVGKSDSFKSLVSVGLTLANTFIKVADIAKPLLPILTSIAAVKGSEALFQFGSGFLGGFARQTPNSVGQNAGQALSGARNQQNAATAVNNTRALSTNTNALQSLTSAVQQLNASITNNRRAGPQTINSGGVVRAFARGGVVPGVGNSDTVPAMLQPGEFVIRKKAVETIGAGNLQRMNKYGGGGSIRPGMGKRRRYASGGLIEDIDYNYTYDGDSINVDYTPTQAARELARSNAGQVKMYQDSKKSYTVSSRLKGVDTPEISGRGSRGKYKDLASLAQEITEDWAESRSDAEMEAAFEAANALDFYDRPMFYDPGLVKSLKDMGVAKDFTTKKGQRMPADIFLGRMDHLKKKFPNFSYKDLLDEVNDSEDIPWPNARSGKKDAAFFQRYFAGGAVQKFAKGGKTKKTEGLLMSALKGYKDDLFGSSLPDILKTQGLSSILDKIEKAYGVSAARVIGAGGENVAFDIGQEILKISRTGSGAQQLLRDYGVNKKAIQKIGNYQLPSNVPGVTGYRNIKAFGKLTAALQDKVSSPDSEKSLRDYELLQGKLAKAGQYWLDAGPSNMGYDKKGNPTVIDGLVFSKAFVNKNVGKDRREDIEVEGMMAEDIYDRWSKKQKGRQRFAVGGLAGLKQVATRRVGIIDTDVLRDPTNKDKVAAAMKQLGLTDTSEYSIELARRAVAARKAGTLLRMRSIAGAAGSGKSSLATGVGANDDATLRRTIRSQILTPEDLAGVDEVLALTSTASDKKLEAYLKSADRTYILSSSTADERGRITANREQRDRTGQGLYGRKPGQTAGATTDFALDETILRDELGSKAVVLGRKAGSYGLRRKRDEELPEIVQAGGFYTGGFAPPTRGHRGALNSLLARMMKQNPNASIEDIVVSVAPDLPMVEGSEGIQHSARYGIFPTDFRALLSKINFGGAMVSTQDQPPGGLPKFMEVAGAAGRRRFARLRGAMAVTSGKEDGVLGKYERAGIQVEDIPRIEDISATKVRDALFTGNDKLLTEFLDPEIASILMGNRAQLRNRSVMVPMLLDKIKEVVEVEKANTNAQVEQLLSSAPGGPYKNVSAKLRENAPEFAEQIKQLRSQRDSMARGAFGYRAYNVIQTLASQYPELYGLDPSRKASVSANAPDLNQEMVLSQITEGMKGVFSATSATAPESGLQQAILDRVQRETATRGSGILPASNEDILSTLGDEVIPNDSKFGQFAGKTILQHLKKGKNRLPYWLSGDYKSLMRRPGEIAGLTEEDVAAYTATREYVSNLFKQKQKGTQQTLLEETAQKIAQTQMLAIVGLKGKNAITGPLTWNLGNNAAGEPVSVDATIMERVLPPKYKAVADYINEQTGNIVNTAASMLTGSDPSVKLDAKKREVLNQGNIEGGILEQLIATLGAGVLDDAARTRPVDFPNGIGEVAAKIFGIDPNIPTEAKRTIDSGTRDKAIEEFQRHFRGVYGVAEPAGDLVQQFARGGKVDDLLAKYKDVIKSIMPAEYIADDGFLKLPGGGSLKTNIDYDPRANLGQTISSMLGFGSSQKASTSGVGERVLLYNLRKNKEAFSPSDFQSLEQWLVSQMPIGNTISLGKTSTNALSHEAFHTIQGYLAENYPDKYSQLNNVTNKYKNQVIDIYKTSAIKNSKYSAKSLFPQKAKDSSYYGSYSDLRRIAPNALGSTLDRAEMDLGVNEVIPLLISASQQYGDSRATKLLETIFTEAGLNSNFASTMPQGYFWGGKVDPLAKKYGLSQSEFEEQKKIAKFMGLNDKDFEEKLRLFASQKKRVKGAKFAALDSLADSSTSVSRLTAEQQALNEFLQTNKFAEGGTATLEKASKNYGKIALRNDGSSISANYFKQGADALLGGATMRSGHIMASKIDSDLYQVGLSGATKGYGPRLYDVVMEAVTENGAMLTSDRSLVSGDAKRVWEYYFNNRGDVKKTPLKPKNWTKNQSLIDPKLYGREETWPPSTDPAWILQSGYSKAPSLINDPNAVVRSDKQQDTRSMALQYFQRAATGGSIRRFAQGGSTEDTVPALLTPGEFVINKKAAQSIGYSKLQKLNHADKLKGYNKGGIVGGVQRFNVGGNVASDAQLTAVSDAMSKALRALPENIGDLVREFNIQTTQLRLGDSFDQINLKLRQQLLIAQKDISNLGPEFVEGVRKVLGEGIKRLDNIELDTIRSSPSYKGPGKEYYADVEKARAGRKVFESGASDAKDLMQAMARSVAGVGGEQYPKPLVSTPKMRPEDYYSRLNYSDIGGSGDIGESGRKYARALAGEDPIKVNALVERLRKEMENAAKAAGIALSKWGKSESWAMWDVGKQLHMQQNPGESSDKYRLANPLNDAQIQKEIVQRHLGWEATGGKNPTTGERLSSAELTDLGAIIEKNGGYTEDLVSVIKDLTSWGEKTWAATTVGLARVEAAIRDQTEAEESQTDTSIGSSGSSSRGGSGGGSGASGGGAGGNRGGSGNSGGGSGGAGGGGSGGSGPTPTRRNPRRPINPADVQERYRNLVSTKLNAGLVEAGNRALGLGAALAVPLESLSRFAGSTTVAGKVLSSLASSSSQLAATFNNSINAIRGFANFADSRLGQRILGSLSQSLGTLNLNRLLGQRLTGTSGISSTVGGVATAFAAGTAAAVALTQVFVDYSNAIKASRIEEAQRKQEESLTKSAEALEKYSKTQDRATLELANSFATSAGSAAIAEANARSAGDRRLGIQTGASLGGGALLGGAIGTAIAPGIGTAIGAAIGGTVSAAIAQALGADRQKGSTASESASIFSRSRGSIMEVFNQRFMAGESSDDIMRRPEWNAQKEVLARSNAAVEAIIRGIQADASLSEQVKKSRIDETLQIEASAQLRRQEQIWLKQKGLIDLDNATKAYTRSLKNMFANMDEAISRTSTTLENFSSTLDLAEASVKGQAKIGTFRNEAANIIKNPRAATAEERSFAANSAGSFFGTEQNTIRGLLTVGPQIESAVLAAIQSAQTLPGSTTDESIGAAIRKSVRDELSSSSLPQELSDKLGQQIAMEIEKRRKTGDDKVDFRDLEEAIPQLKDSVEALKGAQDIAIKALEDYTQKVGFLVDKSNTAVELLIQASEFNRKALDIQFEGGNQLTRTFGGSINPANIQAFNNQNIRNQTGGLTSPSAILENLNKLENRRAFQQSQLQSAQDRGRSGARDVLSFTEQLSRTTRSLRDNQQALQELANNTEAASAALEKISELQAKTQAGQNIIERYVTSTREDNFKLSAAFERLDNNMRGMLNNPLASRNVMDAMRESDNPALAADQAAAQDRRDTLDAFNMIAPFLGNGKEQNSLRANVLESMLKETGIGLTPMFNDVLKSLRNPEGDSEMSQLIEQYKESIKIQSQANEALGQLNANFAQNLKQSSEEAFKNAIQSTLVKFEEAQVRHLEKIQEILSRGPGTPATAKASGGIVYRNEGGSIFQSQGTDTVPAMLTPGEFVVNKASTQKYGSVLKAINSNKYSSGGEVRYYAKGGYVSSVLANREQFTADASKNETEAFGRSPDYYQNEDGTKSFSKNRHFDPQQIDKLLSDRSSIIELIQLNNNPKIVPVGLQSVSPESFKVGALSSNKERADQFEKFIRDGVMATALAPGFYSNYKMAVNGNVIADPAPTALAYTSLAKIPEPLIKSVGTLKEMYLEKSDLSTIPRVSRDIEAILKEVDPSKYSIYNRQKYTDVISSQLSVWNKEGKNITDVGGGIDNGIFTRIKVDMNNLPYTKGFGDKAVFLTSTPQTGPNPSPIINQPVAAMSRSGNLTGLAVNDEQIITGDPGDPIVGRGGYSVGQMRSSPANLSVLPAEHIYQTSQDSISETLQHLQTIREDFLDVQNELKMDELFVQPLDKKPFGPATIYSNKYQLYQEALYDISRGLIERAQFEKSILDKNKLDKLNPLDGGKKIDPSKLSQLYVWSKRSFNASKLRSNPRFKNANNIGVDFPITDLNTGITENFVWSLVKDISGSSFIESMKPYLDKKNYLQQQTFAKDFDAPWAKNNKVNIEFPFQILKKLPIYKDGAIDQEYTGFSIDSSTFGRSVDDLSINPFKLANREDLQDPAILLASSVANAETILTEKIKKWINSNAGQVPTKSIGLGSLDQLVRMTEDDLDIIPENNDLSRETEQARKEIFGGTSFYKQLAGLGVLYRKDDQIDFNNLDLDPSMIDNFKSRRDLNKVFEDQTLTGRLPSYADGQLIVKNERIKTKKSLLDDFIAQSSIQDLSLKELAPWTQNIQDQRIGDLFTAGPAVPDNLRKVYTQTLAWKDKYSKATYDLMNQTEAKYPGKFQELMSLLQLAFYVNGGKTPGAATALAGEFENLQRGFFGNQDLSSLSVFEDSRVAGKKGKQWWKEIGPDWTGFARNNLSIISRKQLVSQTQEVLNKAIGFTPQDAQNLAEGINVLGADGSVKKEVAATNLRDLVGKLLDTTKVYTEGYRLDIADTLQRVSLPDGVDGAAIDNIKAWLNPASDLVSYLAFKDAILSRPLSKVEGIKVQDEDRDIKAPRLANYVPDEDDINGINPWTLYTNANKNFNNISTAFKDVTSLIGTVGADNSIKALALQNPKTIYDGPSTTFDGKMYANPAHFGADPIKGTGAYAVAYKALVGTAFDSIFDKNEDEAGSSFRDSTQEDRNVIYRSSGGPVGYYAGGGSIINFKPKGTDTVPAMLTPGEFVVNRQATQNNLPLLQAINSQNYQTGGKVQYLQRGSQVPVQATESGGWFRQFVDFIRSSSDEDILGFGNAHQTMSLDRFKQFAWDLTAGGWAGFGGDIPRGRMRPVQTRAATASSAIPSQGVASVTFDRNIAQTTWQPSARSLASKRNREANPYVPPAEDPTAYSPSSRAEASRKARESYKPQYSAESYISDNEALQASREFEQQYKTRKENLLKRELMLEDGPASSINLATPTMPFQTWDQKYRTEGRIVAYDSLRQLLTILKTTASDIGASDKKTSGITSFPMKLLGPSFQEAVLSLIANREMSTDDPYPYQRVGINDALSRLEKTYGSDFVKPYRSRDRISTINTSAGQVYDPNQGFIASKLSNYLLGIALEKEKTYRMPTAEAMPEESSSRSTASTPNFPEKEASLPKPKTKQTSPMDEIVVFGQEMRKWIDSTGKYATVAKLTAFLNQYKDVKLNKPTNKNVVVPVDKLSDFDRNYLNKVRSSANTVKPQTQAQQQAQPEQTTQAFENKDRLWYGGRLWDLNNDGVESEKIIGRINRILDADRVMIDTNSVSGGQLILRREYMNQEDLAIVKAWENQRKMTAVNKQTGGMIYASNGQLVNFQPRGTDTIPAMLTPGEFVVNRQATQKNLPLLQTMNNGGVIYRRNGSTAPEGRKTFRDYQADMQGNPVADKYIDRDALAKDYAGRNTKDWWKIFKEGQEAYNRIVGSLLVKDIDPNQPDNTRKVIGNENYMSVNNQTGAVTQVKSPTLTPQGIPDYINEYNRNNFNAPKKANKDLWSETEKREYIDAYNLGSQRNAVQAEQRARVNAENKAARTAFMYDYGLTPEEQQKKDNIELERIQKGIEFRKSFGLPGTTDELTAMIYGVGSKAIPALSSVAVGGLAMGMLAPLALPGGALLMAGVLASMAGDYYLGNPANKLAYDKLLPDSLKKDIEAKIAENPEQYNTGRWIGLGAEIAGGAKFAPMLAQRVEGVMLSAAESYGKVGLAQYGKPQISSVIAKESEEIAALTARNSASIISGKQVERGAAETFIEAIVSEAKSKAIQATVESAPSVVTGQDPERFAAGGLVSELSGLYQRRLTAQKEASSARDQWFVVPLKAGKTSGDTSTIFDNTGNKLPASEILTLDDNQLATLYGKDSKLLKQQAQTKYPWFDAKQHRLVMGQGIYRNQKQAFSKQDPALKIIDELAYEFKAMPNIFELKNKDAYTDENIDTDGLLKSLQDPNGTYVETQTKAAAEMLQNRNNFLTTLFLNAEEALDMVMDYLSANGRDSTIRAAFGGEDPDNILQSQKSAVSGELESIFGLLQNENIAKYAKNVKNNFNRSRILDFGNAPKSLKDISSYFAQNKPKTPEQKQTGPSAAPVAQMATGGRVPYYLNNGAMVNFTPRGTDTVPAMLTPGEFVVNRRATQKNLPLLKQINSQNYQRGGVVQYYQRGSQGPVQQGSVGGMYSLSLDDKSISLMREFTSKFAEFSSKLANLTLPSLRIDETTLTSLNDFTKRFDNFSKELLKLNIPPVITITGKHDVNVNINGASVFSNMDKYVSNMIKNEINNAFAQLARETDGAISMNYSPSAYSNQNTQNLA